MPNEFVQTMADARVDAKSLSEFIYKPANFMVQRRLAPPINTLNFYIDFFNKVASDGARDIDQSIINSGFIIVDSFGVGATLTQRNQALRDAADGRLYRWAGDLPKVVPESSTPASAGGTGANAWMEVSDVTLAQKLSISGGASKIGDGVSVFKDLADFIESVPNMTLNSNVFLEQIYQDGDLEHRGNIYKYTDTAKPDAINIAVNGGFLSREYNNYVFAAEFGCAPVVDGVHTATNNGEALQAAFNFLRPKNGHKTLSMGTDCYYAIAGTVYAHVSDIHWSFNNTTVKPIYLLVAWHSKQKSYGDYKNIKISKARYIGDASQVGSNGRGVTVLHHDLHHIDGLTVEDCTFAECILLGHILDIISCRDINVLNNTFLGSLSKGVRDHTEMVQVSATSSISGYGVPPQEGWGNNLSGLRVRNLKYIGNTVKPYENPVTGIVSYPTRPLGDHNTAGVHNVTVRDNTFTDILLPSGADSLYNYMLNLECYDNIEISNNRVSMTDTTAKIFRINGYVSEASNPPRRAQYKITDNIINIARANPSLVVDTVEHIKEQNLISVRVAANAAPASSYPACDITISGNNIHVTNSIAEGFALNAFITTDINTNESILKIDNNIFVAKNSKVRSFISNYAGFAYSANKVGWSTVVSNNIFKGNVEIGVWHERNGNTPSYMGGTVKIKSNIFDNNYKAVDISTNGFIYFNDNVLSGYANNTLLSPDANNDGNSLVLLNSSRVMSVNNALSQVPSDKMTSIKPVYVNSAPADSTAYGLSLYSKL